MKYLDFSFLLDSDPANIAFLSTYQFDPDFFERRLLGCRALAKAKRIVVFMDARQWLDLLRRDVPARWLNRRYLVVPIQHSQGVFHPKLSLFLADAGGNVLCGSNNLTRAGCSSNLELLNAVPFNLESDHENEDGMSIAKEAFIFFERATKNADDEIARIAKEWIEETKSAYPWIKLPVEKRVDRKIRLIHTYDGRIWDQLILHLSNDAPQSFFVISPFHDTDGGICHRLVKQWPNAKIEMLIQQEYTNLAIQPLKKFRTLVLSELQGSSRRVHAKLLAWNNVNGGGCLVGSANFTTAAFDGRNVEACFLISDTHDLVDALFDKQISRRSINFDDFIPGDIPEPDIEEDLLPLKLNSALLTKGNSILVSFSHNFELEPSSLRLKIRAPGETRPRVIMNLSKRAKSKDTVLLPEAAIADIHGTLLASLIAELDGKSIESLPVWVIQENRLTYNPSEGSSTPKEKIEDTGEGLPEYIDELGNREGVSAVIDYLKHLNIRFLGGNGDGPGQRKFRLKIRDPWVPGVPPEWLIEAKSKSDDLEEAIYEFVERHEKRRLRRHAKGGNINGMENFLDILNAMVRLLYTYYKRGIVKKSRLIESFCAFIDIATGGSNEENDQFKGYLYSVFDNLGGDVNLLQEVCKETNFLAEVIAVLLIAQSVRFNPNGETRNGVKLTRPRDYLPDWAKAISKAIFRCGLSEPEIGDVCIVLEHFRMFTKEEISQLIGA